MPFPAAAAIGAGGSILQTGLNAAFTAGANKKQRKWNEKMYSLQREHALADWNMMNQYNSPQEQMKRLIAAGLNPNLVYDNGATHSAAPVRSSDVAAWRPDAPQIDLSGLRQAGMDIYEIQLKEAQTKNLQSQQEVLNQDAALRAAQTAQTVANTDKTQFDLSQGKRLADTAVAQAEANLSQTKTGTTIALQANDRAAAQNAQSLAEGVERIKLSRLQQAKTQDERNKINTEIQSVIRDINLKQLDIDLKKVGIQPQDAIWWRILGRLLNEFKDDLPKLDPNKY